MYVPEVSILDQIYTLLGANRSDEMDFIIVFIAGIVLCMLINNTLGALMKGLLGGYERQFKYFRKLGISSYYFCLEFLREFSISQMVLSCLYPGMDYNPFQTIFWKMKGE